MSYPSKAKQNLGWVPKISFEELAKEMTRSDLEEAKRDDLCQRAGYRVFHHNE
jgi:GDPmannose 4,6-dehydratase